MNTTTVLQHLASWVLWNSSGAAALIVMILAVRLVAGRAMSARLRSRLWVLVLVRLMLPLLPAVSLPGKLVSRASTFIPQRQEVTQLAPPIALPAPKRAAVKVQNDDGMAGQFIAVEDGMGMMPTPPVAAAPDMPATVIAAAPITPKRAPINWQKIVLLTWLAGSTILLARLVITTIRLTRFTRQLSSITDPKIVELLGSCCELFAIGRAPQVLDSAGAAPALVGFIRPRILLPASLASTLSLDEIRMIFLHELAHLKRRDVLLNYLFAILASLHWFNPLLWIASHRMAVDRELACDDMVLRITSRRQARLYGCTLLKLVELLNFQRLPAGAVGVVQNKTLIQRRIDMIASYPARNARSSMFVRAAALSLAIAAGVSAIRAQALPEAPKPPGALPAPTTPPATASVVPQPSSAAPLAGISADAAPRAFSVDEIEAVNPTIAHLRHNLKDAQLQVDALKDQGLLAESKPMKIAAKALRDQQRSVASYVKDWNERYTIQAAPDGTPIAVRKDNGTLLLPSASGMSAVIAQPVSPRPPSAGNGPVGIAVKVAPSAPSLSSALPMPPGAPTPAASPEAAPSALPVPLPAPTPDAAPSLAPPAPVPPGAAPASALAPPTVDPTGPITPAAGTPPSVPLLRDPALFPGGSANNTPGDIYLRGIAPMRGAGAQPHAAGATASVEDAAMRQANIDVMQKLANNHDADMNHIPLREALSMIADATGVDIIIDERAIAEIGVDAQSAPVTLHVQPKPMEQILSLTLRLTHPQLDYSVYNGVVFVSSRDALNRRIVTRIYDVPAKHDAEAVLHMIDSAVGSARCNSFDDKIVVTAPEVAQRDIARLLAQIAPSQGARASKTMFLYQFRTGKASELAAKFPKELGSAVAEERTNSVLITTSQLDAAKEFITRLDGDRSEQRREDASLQVNVDQKKIAHAEADLKRAQDELTDLTSKQQADPENKELAHKLSQVSLQVVSARLEVEAEQATLAKDSAELEQMQKGKAVKPEGASSSQGASAKPLDPALAIEKLKTDVVKASESRRHSQEVLGSLTRREIADAHNLDPNFPLLKKVTQRQVEDAQMWEKLAQDRYDVAAANASKPTDNSPGR